MTQEGALKLKEKFLEQEKDLMVSQNEWLTQELNARSEQLIQLRKERFTTVANMNAQLASKNEEVGRRRKKVLADMVSDSELIVSKTFTKLNFIIYVQNTTQILFTDEVFYYVPMKAFYFNKILLSISKENL